MIPAAFDYSRPASARRGARPAGRQRRHGQGPGRWPEPPPAPQAASRPARAARRHRPAGRAPRRSARCRTAASRSAPWRPTPRCSTPTWRGHERRSWRSRSRASATSRSATGARSAARSPTPTRPRTCRRSCWRSMPGSSLRSTSGERVVAADDFFEGAFATDLAEDELLTEIRIPAQPDGCRGGLPAARAARLGLLDRRRRRRRRPDRRARSPPPGSGSPASPTPPTGRRRSRPRSSARDGDGGRDRGRRRARGGRGGRQRRHPRRRGVPSGDGPGRDPSGDRGGARRRRLTCVRVRLERIVPGRHPSGALAGAVLTRDLVVDGERWAKGRRLDGGRPGRARPAGRPRRRRATGDRLVRDRRPRRRARTTSTRTRPPSGWRRRSRGPGLVERGPAESRVDLRADRDGVVHVRTAHRRADGPDRPARGVHAVRRPGGRTPATSSPASRSRRTSCRSPRSRRPSASASRAGPKGVVRVAGFVPRRVAAVVKESLHAPARERFEASVRLKVESLGSTLGSVAYVEDDPDAVTAALAAAVRGRRRRARGPRAHGRLREHRPVRPVLRRDRAARRASRPPRRAGPPRLDALAGPRRRRRRPRAADLRRLLEGDRGRPAPAAAPVRRAGERGHGRPARRRRHPHPLDALPLPGATPGSSTRPTAEATPGRPAASR